MTECVDCAALPELPGDPLHAAEDVEYRPVRPRPAPHGGPRSRRCTTHHRAWKAGRKAARAAYRRLTVYGLDADTFEALWELQGRACPCGRQPTREPDTDHDHALARQHDHPVENACPDCLRGMTCRACNRDVLGRYNPDQLRALADYLEDPPMAQLRRRAA